MKLRKYMKGPIYVSLLINDQPFGLFFRLCCCLVLWQALKGFLVYFAQVKLEMELEVDLVK